MKQLKIAVVGLGHRGRLMVKLAKEGFDNVQVLAACDLDAELWEKQQYLVDRPMKDVLPGTKFYTSYDQLLEEHGKELDLVMVETGADVHAKFCIKALEKDIAVFSDIPSVASLGEAKALWEAEQKSKAGLMTGANPNYAGFVNTFVGLFERGLMGDPFYLECEYVGGTMGKLSDDSPILAHSDWRRVFPAIRYCTHSLGPFLRFLKEDLRYAICLGTGAHVVPTLPADDMQAAFFQTESGVIIRLLRNRCDGKIRAEFGHHSFRGWGTKGYFERVDYRNSKTPPVIRFQSTEMPGTRSLTELKAEWMPEEYEGNPKAMGHGGCDYALLDDMFKALEKGKKEFPISLREGLRMTLPGIYAAKSAYLKGEKLTIHYPWEKEFAADVEKYDAIKEY